MLGILDVKLVGLGDGLDIGSRRGKIKKDSLVLGLNN